MIVDRRGTPIGCSVKGFNPPQNVDFKRGCVYAVTTHFRSDYANDFRESVRRDRWNVVLPEFVYRT